MKSDIRPFPKTVRVALAIFAACTLHAAEDGISSGKAFSAQDPAIEIGDYVSLRKGGETVYHRLHSRAAVDLVFREQFLVDGQAVLEIRRLKNSVEHVWKRDPEGFYSNYSRQSRHSVLPRF